MHEYTGSFYHAYRYYLLLILLSILDLILRNANADTYCTNSINILVFPSPQTLNYYWLLIILI